MSDIIGLKKSIVPACDVSTLRELEQIVRETNSVKGIGAYKVGFVLALKYGLPEVVKLIKSFSDKPIIYDHQKAATDIPAMGEKFAETCKKAGLDAIILFPQAGPETERAWIKACKEAELGVIVGGEMTHPAYLQCDGGFLENRAPEKMYEIAINEGVTDFVVPGNKPERIAFYRKLFEEKGIDASLYSPGLVAQGGSITDSGKEAGKRWHAIVGRGIYQAEDKKKAAEELVKNLTE
jgi:orotidine-5'-phosphate decarboxylase